MKGQRAQDLHSKCLNSVLDPLLTIKETLGQPLNLSEAVFAPEK